MNFKKHIQILASAALLSGMAFTACDDVKEGDRYIELPKIEVERGALLVDFTGQMCVNCPAAHEAIEQLEEQYGRDKLVAVSVHGGSLAMPVEITNFNSGLVGLMVAEGRALNEAWSIDTWPRGVINLTGQSMNFDQWPAAVRAALSQATDIELKVETTYAAKEAAAGTENGRIDIKATVTSHEEHGNLYVQYWITEDGIQAMQRFPDKTDNNYIHNNVLRAMVKSMPGEKITLTPGEASEFEASVDCRYNDKERWAIDNLYVIAYVYEDGKGVQQVVRHKVVPAAE